MKLYCTIDINVTPEKVWYWLGDPEKMENHTHLTVIADVRFKSFMRLLSLLFWPAFKKQVLRQFKQELERLKELCEQGT